MGELLKQVYERQLDGEIQTLDEALAEAQRLIGEREAVSSTGGLVGTNHATQERGFSLPA